MNRIERDEASSPNVQYSPTFLLRREVPVSNLRKIAPIAFTFACTLGFSPVPARAAYCGNVADTAAIERLIVADIYEYHFDRTWIEDIAVVGTFARADIAG